MTPRREQKFKEVVARRQPNLTIILENVHDPHNIGAVLRTADSVGLKEIFVVNTEAHLQDESLYLGNQTSSGSRKWVKVNFYTAVEPCFAHIKRDYDTILATHLAENSKDLYELDLTASVALLFGNEHAGISKESLAHTDGNFLIPQVGMVESLNISVACAVTLYEALRQRMAKGFYKENLQMDKTAQAELYAHYCAQHLVKEGLEMAPKLNG
ncbi:MAG: tRNA (guanosine-2'-O-)-methyltransferase [Paraglaciecola sp.]|jgi:tRNA (guanosine-2'-O-)-methyltransferase